MDYGLDPNYTQSPGYVYDELEHMIDHPPTDADFWQMPRFMVRHALEVRRAGQKKEADWKAKHETPVYDGIKTHIYTEGVKLTPGVYTEQFRGQSSDITECMNAFHQTLHKVYNDKAKILNMAPVQLANGTCMYVTFQIF